MFDNPLVSKLFFKTFLVSAFIGAVAMVRWDFFWGFAFTLAAGVGLINWMSLAAILIGYTKQKTQMVLIGLFGKFVSWPLIIFLVLSPLSKNISALLLGLTTFLLVALLEGLGELISARLSMISTTRPLPSHLLKGRPEDA